jgi:hypothetical protein
VQNIAMYTFRGAEDEGTGARGAVGARFLALRSHLDNCRTPETVSSAADSNVGSKSKQPGLAQNLGGLLRQKRGIECAPAVIFPRFLFGQSCVISSVNAC